MTEREEKRFLVIGGKVMSRHDGDIHFIPPLELCRLYGLNPKSPNVRLISCDSPRFLRGYDESWIRLEPRYNGDYSQYMSKVL